MTQSHTQTRDYCRVCNSSNLIDILDLGDHYVSDFVDGEVENVKAPLTLVFCENCTLVQLKHHAVDSNVLYRNYWYKSGMNQTMRDALAEITSSAQNLVSLKPDDIVIDIGANDGTLLRSYTTNGIKRVGFEPARNLIPETKVGTDLIINDFFNRQSFLNELGSEARAKVITTIAMFYDLEDPNTFVADLAACLDKEGVWINQMAYQPLMLELNAFDNICHEHVEYYSLLSLKYLLDKHDLEIFDVELNDVNGGSFRIFIKHKDSFLEVSNQGKERVKKLFKKEEAEGVNKPNIYQAFAERVKALKTQTVNFIEQEVHNGKKVHVYGASTKGNTLLQYYGLDNQLIEAAAERNPDKWGLKTVGTSIPIMSEADSRALKPDYYLVLPWHFKEEFITREKEYLQHGGKMIFPLPKFEIIEA